MVICLERGADLLMAQLMPLPHTVSCFSKIQIGFTFLVPAHLGSPGKGPLNGCVCVCVIELWPTRAAWCGFGRRTQCRRSVPLPLQLMSLRLSVTFVCCTQTAKDIDATSFASCSPAILVSGV